LVSGAVAERQRRVDHDARILGGDFVAEMLKEANKKLRAIKVWRKKLNGGVIHKMCKERGRGTRGSEWGQRRRVSKVRSQIAYYLSHELGISMAEIAGI
jgi:hypothetical protein